MTIYQQLTLLSTILSLGLTLYTYRMPKVKTARIYFLLMILITIFAMGSFLELMVSDLAAKVFWRNICQIGYLLSIPTLLILVLIYTGKKNLLKPFIISLVYLLPVSGLILRWTDPFHHLMRKDVFLANEQLIIISTSFAEIFMFLERALVVGAIVLLLSFYHRCHWQYKKQIIVLVTGIMIPLTVEMIKAIRPDVMPFLPPTAVTLALTGVVIFLGVFRHQLFSIIPLARDMIIDVLEGEKEHCCEYKEVLSAAIKQVRDTYLLVENLLNWFWQQKDSLAHHPVNSELYPLVEDAISVYRSNIWAKGLRIINEIDRNITVFSDKDLLELILRNLIHNAIKFTDHGGVICFRAYPASNNKVIVSISDTGIGIAPERAKTLFSENLTISSTGTAGETGTGLGLLISKEFIQHNGGAIWVESELGKGSTFYFSLPSD